MKFTSCQIVVVDSIKIWDSNVVVPGYQVGLHLSSQSHFVYMFGPVEVLQLPGSSFVFPSLSLFLTASHLWFFLWKMKSWSW